MSIDVNELYTGLLPSPTILSHTVDIVEYYPHPTKDEIDIGVMVRYFVRQANHRTGYITEITKAASDTLKDVPVYKTISLEWKITGALDDILGPQHINTPVRLYTGVRTANELTATRFDKEMPGLKDKLRNYVQFWIGF